MHDIRFAEIDGFNIAYHRQGAGEPMLLVHGISTYSFIWRNLIPSLSSHFDVIAIDLLGCGDSDKPAGVDYSISAQADMIHKFLNNLGIGKVHLVTHDIGGGVGQIMAVKYSDKLRSLVLINTVAYDYWPVQPIITMRIPIIRQIAMSLMDLGILKALVRRGTYYKERVTDELMELFWKPLKTREGRQGFLQLARSLNNMDLMRIAGDLRNMQMPVLIVRGDDDAYLGPEICEKLHDEIKNSRLVRIQNGGHFIQEDKPELLASLILKFIREKHD